MNIGNTTRKFHEQHLDATGSRMGMWLFLFTELLFFGGLFLLYAVYRSQFSQEFIAASAELNMTVGAVNTIVLITSSLTMALSITAVKNGDPGSSLRYQLFTIFLAVVFLIVKYFEWSAKISHGIYPGSAEIIARGQGAVIFYSLYFVMTGIHGLHVLAGAGVIAFMLNMTRKGMINRSNNIRLENTGLYWHFVDVVWIYLFPLLYLIG